MAFLKGLGKLVLIGIILLGLCLVWKANLRFGPGLLSSSAQQAPAMYAFHAKALVVRQLEHMPAPEMLLPTPQTLSNADVQLRLMKLRDAKSWLPAAYSLGESTPQGLRLRNGKMVVVALEEVGAPTMVSGDMQCRVRVRSRWEFPEEASEIYRVRDIVGLKLSKGLEPGQSSVATFTFLRRGWTWEFVRCEAPWIGKAGATASVPSPSFVDWLY